VVTESGQPVADALVLVTMAPDRTVLSTRSTATGAVALQLVNGHGDYLVHVSAVGYTSFRIRLRAVTPADSVLSFQAQLRSATATLGTVHVQAQRIVPPRWALDGTEVAAAETMPEGVSAAVIPDARGDVNALAAVLPGVLAVDGGISMFGLPPTQTSKTLNGLPLSEGALPRDLRQRLRVTSSTYDPARGGFSAGEIAVDVGPGSPYSYRSARLTIDTRQLQVTSAPLASPYDKVAFGGAAAGALSNDRYYYNVGADMARATEDGLGAERLKFGILNGHGIEPAVLQQLTDYLAGTTTPLAGMASAQTSEMALFARVDHTPYANTSWALTAALSLRGSDGVNPGGIDLPSSFARERAGSLTLVAEHAAMLGVHLNQFKSGISGALFRTEPVLTLPSAEIAFAPTLADSTTRTILSLGGLPRRADQRSWTWSTIDDVQWFSSRTDHRLKIHVESRLEGLVGESLQNGAGHYTYASLDDFFGERPSAYVRTLGASGRAGGEWNGAVAFGDQWRVSPRLSILYGIRTDADRATVTPDANPGLTRVFGVRTDQIASHVALSPRVGFNWLYAGGGSPGFTSSDMATHVFAPPGLLRGGVGLFRNAIPAALSAALVEGNGLPTSLQTVACVGVAVPEPAWMEGNGDAPLPTSCAGGASPFSIDRQPSVFTLSPSYDAPQSWRANLAWVSVLKHIAVTLDVSGSLNVSQPSLRDVNFQGTPTFALRNEGERSVYTPLASISNAGVASFLGSRLDQSFGRVLVQESDLRSFSRQVSLVLTPELPTTRVFISGGYAFGRTTGQARGFDLPTSGDPRDIQLSPTAFDARHDITLQAGLELHSGLTLSAMGRLRSGLPFTPVVAGDINGDGVGPDAAFIFDPRRAPASVGTALSALITPDGLARDCLARQVGRIAATNSCRYPWSQALNARLTYVGWQRLGRHPTSVSLTIINVPAALDRVMHGDGAIRGWGLSTARDPVLYTVTGFDASAREYRYAVNPQFGSANGRFSFRGSPFRVGIDAQVDLSVPRAQQLLSRTLDQVRGTLGRDSMATAILGRYRRTVPNIFTLVLAESDSLMLTPQQVDRLNDAAVQFQTRADSVWGEVAKYLAEVPGAHSVSEALPVIESATDRVWEIARVEASFLPGTLSPLQLALAPGLVKAVLQSDSRTRLRVY
jgi:hypothetical protein